MPEHPCVAVVIPVFNRWPQTARCLAALAQTRGLRPRIYVVDHGSTDDTAAALAAEFPEVIRVAGTSDWWWAAATNAGIERARAEGATHIMLLNNDCTVRPDTLPCLLRHLQHPAETVVAPLQVALENGRVAPYKVRTALALGFATLRDPWPLPARGLLQPVRLIMGGRGVLIPVEVFARIGLLDAAHLPHYAADHDFYLRARKAGITLAVATDARVDVDNSGTTLAARYPDLSLGAFLRTLRERRSHRNLTDLRALFRKHHPVPGLYWTGVFLSTARYVTFYALRRTLRLITGGRPRKGSSR